MPLWQKLLITLAGMLLAGLVAGLIWDALFAAPLPSYLGGVIGGLVAIPLWSFLGRVRPKA